MGAMHDSTILPDCMRNGKYEMYGWEGMLADSAYVSVPHCLVAKEGALTRHSPERRLGHGAYEQSRGLAYEHSCAPLFEPTGPWGHDPRRFN